MCFFYVKGQKKGWDFNIAVYLLFVITAVYTLIFKHYSVTHSKNNKSVKVSGPLLSALFILPLTKKKTDTLHSPTTFFLLFLPPTPLLAFFHHSLRPGSHYCFSKYFIGLNTFAHRRLSTASSLTHRPWIDRSKWKRAKRRLRRRMRNEGKGRVCPHHLPSVHLHFQWARAPCLVSWLHNRLLSKDRKIPWMLSNLCPTTFCFLRPPFFPFFFFCPKHFPPPLQLTDKRWRLNFWDGCAAKGGRRRKSKRRKNELAQAQDKTRQREWILSFSFFWPWGGL